MMLRIRLLTPWFLVLIALTGCGQSGRPREQPLSEEAAQLLDDIRSRSHNEFHGRMSRPLPGVTDGWPKLIGPLLQSLDDEDTEFAGRVARVLDRVGRRDIVPEDELTAARTILAYLDHENAKTRYHAARIFLRAIPAGRLNYHSPEAESLLTLWKPHAHTLEQHLDRNEPRTDVYIAAALLRLSKEHANALACLRQEMETVKEEYDNFGFELSSSFPLLGVDAKPLVPIAIRHTQYGGSWADPNSYGRRDLEDMGTIAVPFIAKEIAQSESSLLNKDESLESEPWHRSNVLRFLSLLELMALNAKFTGTDVSAATPVVTRLAKSDDPKIQQAAQSTLTAFQQSQSESPIPR